MQCLSPDAQAYVKAGFARHSEEIADLEGKLTKATSQIAEVRGKRQYGKSRKLIDKRKQLEKELEALRAMKPPRPTLTLTNLAPDDIGVPHVSKRSAPFGWRLEVLQVLGPDEMLIECCRTLQEVRRSWGGAVQGSAEAFRAEHPRPGETVREPVFNIRGISTAGITDGSVFRADMPFRVTGTTTYKTVGGGSKTVFVLEKLDVGKLDETDWFREADEGAPLLRKPK
jgi:hypothetical protein